MQYGRIGVAAILLSALSSPVWSGVPHAHQRQPLQAVSPSAPYASDECLRIDSVEKDIASLKSNIAELLVQLKALNIASKAGQQPLDKKSGRP